MTIRINHKDIEAALDRLNTISKRKYRLNGAYDKWQLWVEEGQGVNTISFLQTTRELYDILHTILKYKEVEERHEYSPK